MTPPSRGVQALARVALGVAVFVFVAAPLLIGREGDVSNSGVTFVETTESTPAATGARSATSRHPADDAFEWPIYGFTKARTHHLPVRVTPRPPYRQAWAYRGRVLLEFAPVLCGRKLFVMKNNAALYALSRRTGAPRWKRKLGALAAASPACSHGIVYAVVLERTRGSKGGRVVALMAKSGKTVWSRKLPSRAESSPLLDRGDLIFGTEDGRVYALRAKDGKVRWTYKAAGAVKGAIALDAGKLYFGDYGGKVHAIRRSDGKKVWRTTPGKGVLGIGEGNFYSSAAVEYGRVYIGSTNGDVYSFSSADGKLAWRKRTGDFVYASPAVGTVAGRPSVYVGSYDGRFYALNARTGKPRWTRSLGRKISGAATIVGDLVFVSDLDKKTTWALGTGTGVTVWKTRRGGFNPVISDGRRIYFAGFSSLFALDHEDRPFDGRPAVGEGAGAAAAARRQATRSARRRAASIRRARAAGRARAARRVRSAARARAESDRRLQVRFGTHGHRHAARRGRAPARCHRHGHAYEVRGRRIALVHSHCHRHVRRRGP